MNVKEQLSAALKRAQELSKAAGERDLTDEELTEVKSLTGNIDGLKAQVAKADEDAALVKRLGEYGKPQAKQADDNSDGADAPAASLGEHFVKHAGREFLAKRGMGGATVAAPDWVPAKANTDTGVTSGGVWSPVLTQVDRTIVRGNRPRLTIADLLGQGTMGQNTNAITYFVEGALEGAFTTVAEAAAKPQLHSADPTTRTDALRKIAAFLKFSDEMTEDLDFFVSEINQRGLYELGRFEEAQLLSGSGTGTNVSGLLTRSGVQTLAVSTAAASNNADGLFMAMTAINTATGLDADGIVLNPTDYQTLRLKKDANNQYFGGGYFQGEYGQGVILSQPPIWGLRTVVTPAITAGTALVGSFQQAATLYRKGGIRVESTNSHASDFTNNLITTRIEERVALAVRVPAAFVAVTLV